MKKYILYAGVNGAGKSTLYATTHCHAGIPRVNTDEILHEFGDWRCQEDLIKAGKIAVRKIRQYLDEGISFNQETTLCGHSVFRTMYNARKSGYRIEMHYVGLEHPQIAISRIKKRVEIGGHGIADEDVNRRYFESLNNLRNALPYCDLAAIYDNTEEFRRFAIYRNNKVVVLSRTLPEWYKKWAGPQSVP